MTVADLIERLEQMDPDANVYLMTQESWPFENTLRGVVQRSDFEEPDEEGYPTGYPHSEDSRFQQTAEDVFLIEGSQIRYGNKQAWNA